MMSAPLTLRGLCTGNPPFFRWLLMSASSLSLPESRNNFSKRKEGKEEKERKKDAHSALPSVEKWFHSCLWYRSGFSFFKTYISHILTDSFKQPRAYPHEVGGLGEKLKYKETPRKSLTFNNKLALLQNSCLLKAAHPTPHKEGVLLQTKIMSNKDAGQFYKAHLVDFLQGEIPLKARVEATFLTLWAVADSLDWANNTSIVIQLQMFLADTGFKEPWRASRCFSWYFLVESKNSIRILTGHRAWCSEGKILRLELE